VTGELSELEEPLDDFTAEVGLEVDELPGGTVVTTVGDLDSIADPDVDPVAAEPLVGDFLEPELPDFVIASNSLGVKKPSPFASSSKNWAKAWRSHSYRPI